MAEYDYIDGEGHQVTIRHRMLYTTSILCDICGAVMWRKPRALAVTWGGLAPSQGQLDNSIQNLVDTAPERREGFEAVHEKHERGENG